MDTTYYPDIPEGVLWQVELIVKNAAADPEYLQDAPYSADDLASLQRLVGDAGVAIEDLEEEDLDTGDKWAKLERETRRLFDGLMKEQSNLSAKDNAEKMSFFRTATSLLDKLVGIQERAANLKQIHIFHDTVMRIMEDVLDPGQRTKVMDELKAAINPENRK